MLKRTTINIIGRAYVNRLTDGPNTWADPVCLNTKEITSARKLKLLAILMVILIGVMSLSGSSACSARRRKKFTDSQLLQRIQQRYRFVENKLVVHSSNHTQINGGINFKTGQKTGTSNCPWTWAIDDDPDRIPRYLAKAECSQCNHYCRAVFYAHNSLIQRCDRKTGTIFWTRMERTLPIAYVYDN
ncbi:hypothetical protein ACROYT_G017974 [Oculina patagonica]